MKLIHRRATLDDFDQIVDLAIESVSHDPLPVKVDRQAMIDTGKTLLNPAHFLWVTEIDGRVEAAVAACVQPRFWFTKLQCSVLLYYSRKPGAGLPLLREFARWVKSRSGIKIAIFELEPGVDPRLVRFIKRLGFERESTNLSYIRPAA